MTFKKIHALCEQGASAEEILEKLGAESFRVSDISHAQDNVTSAVDISIADSTESRIKIITSLTTVKDNACSYKFSKRILYVLEGKLQVVKFSYKQKLIPQCIELLNTAESIMIDANEYHALTKWKDEKVVILSIEVGKKEPFLDKVYYSSETKKIINQLRQSIKDYYFGYDDRYKKVYNYGADLWETYQPNEIVQEMQKEYPNLFAGKIIDLGCGEGRDSLYLASLGCHVLGLDVSRAALDKARIRATQLKIKAKFMERDVIYLRNIQNDNFDLAINMGCLHMLNDPQHRQLHLKRVFEILQPRGYLLLAHCKKNWGKNFFSIPHYEKIGSLVPGTTIDRRIRVSNGHKFVPLEVVPYKEASEEELIQELKIAGFNEIKAVQQQMDAFGDTVAIWAQKN